MEYKVVNRKFISFFSYFYQIAHLGDDDEEPEFSSNMELEEGTTFFFTPRNLKNLVLVDEIDSLAPIMSCQIADLANEDTPQLYAACGRGPRSSLRVLRHGLEVRLFCIQCIFIVLFAVLKDWDTTFFCCSTGLRDGGIRVARQPKCCMDCEANQSRYNT